MPYSNALIQATPRNALLGRLSDALASTYSPERTQQAQQLAQFLSAPAISRTLDRLSYGEPLTTGAGGLGGTTRFNNDALESAMAIAPMVGPTAKVFNNSALAVGRAGERLAERAVPKIMERGGLGAEMLGAMGNRTISPLDVYHGTPHTLPPTARNPLGEFDASKIGTGEGLQGYGYGIYTSEAPSVGKSYQASVSAMHKAQGKSAADVTIQGKPIDWDNPVEIAAFELERHNGNRAAAAEFHAKNFAGGNNNPAVKILKSNQELPSVKLPGNLYKIDLPDEKIAKMLDWDAPLKDQTPEIQALAKQYGLTDADHLGGDLLAAMNAKRAAGANAMREAGIPGVKYLDASSRGAGGTRNFVVFPGEEKSMTILERNGQKFDNTALTGAKFVAPQDEALRLAQQRASLPSSQGGLGLPAGNTPEQRAAAMGFDVDVYHGSKTPENIKKLVAGGESGSIRTGDAYGTGVYTSTDAAGDASAYGRDGAVFPLKINRSGHLKIDAPNANDLEKLSKFAGESMLPSDKARFTVGREKREFANVQDARDFFSNQRENWNQFGGGYDRARPEALANPDGTFAVEFTNFDAPVPITSGKDADTLLRATGYDNVSSLGYSGHTLNRGDERFWDVTTDTDQIRSRFAAFDPFRRTAAIAATMGVAAPDLLAGQSPQQAPKFDNSALMK